MLQESQYKWYPCPSKVSYVADVYHLGMWKALIPMCVLCMHKDKKYKIDTEVCIPLNQITGDVLLITLKAIAHSLPPSSDNL